MAVGLFQPKPPGPCSSVSKHVKSLFKLVRRSHPTVDHVNRDLIYYLTRWHGFGDVLYPESVDL
jgi:hypothetical protein